MGIRASIQNKFQNKLRQIAVFACAALFLSLQTYAGPEQNRLREPNSQKTPCGLYLSSMMNNSTGRKVAEPTLESLAAFFAANPDLAPKLIYIDSVSGKSYSNVDEIKKAMAAGTAIPVLNTPELVWVGLPAWGKKTKELLKATEDLLAQEDPDSPVQVKNLWRPNKEMSSKPAHFVQWLRYVLPSKQLDYQKPLASEKSAAYWKLLVSNGSQQIFLFFVKPPGVAVTTGVMNFVNSYYTGVYRRFMSNWFNRSFNEPMRWARNILLSSFFTADLYWSGRPSWLEFSKILSVGGWGHFIADKWASTLFGVLWRFYYQQGIIKWEKEMDERARTTGDPSISADGRRTAGRLEFLGTFITTPAFIYSTIAPSLIKLSIAGVPIMGLNEGHFMMMAVGAIGALHYYKVPRNPFWYLDKIPGFKAVKVPRNLTWYWNKASSVLPIRPRRSGMIAQYDSAAADPMRFSWDPWVSRLDRFHEFNKSWASKLGVMKAIDFVEKVVRMARSVGWNKNGEASGPVSPLNGDVRKLIDMDKDLLKWLEQDKELHEMIKKDPELRKLIETDPHFEEIRDELLKDSI